MNAKFTIRRMHFRVGVSLLPIFMGMLLFSAVGMYLDGAPVGHGDLPVTIPLSLGLAAGVCVGADAGSPVMTDYKAPFPFAGAVKKALVDVTGDSVEDKAAKMRMYLARQ